MDIEYCAGVVEHFADIHKGLTDIRNSLDGYLYLEIPNRLSTPGCHQMENGSLEWRLSKKAWEQKIECAGFVIVESLEKTPGKFAWILKDSNEY